MMKKIISLVVCLFSIMCLISPVYADEEMGSNPFFKGYRVTRDNNPPTAVWNLATDGQCNIAGEAYGTADLYTLYRFTGVSQICASVRNLGINYTITVTLRRCYSILGIDYSLPVDSFTVSPGTREIASFNVSSNKEYYFSFSAPCIFDGFVV